jgi:general secretion pathway protein G
MNKRTRGYTIIELLVVMAVLGILATAAMPLAELTVKRRKERELKQATWEIRHAIDAFKRASDAGKIAKTPGASGYPASLEMLTAGVSDLTDGGKPAYFLRRIPRDPFAPPGGDNAQTWGLRSYRSSADKPEAGADVFDVYSKSEEVGMNGIPYRQW